LAPRLFAPKRRQRAEAWSLLAAAAVSPQILIQANRQSSIIKLTPSIPSAMISEKKNTKRKITNIKPS